MRSEQRGEAGIGVERGPAQPVDRAVAPDQSRGLAIADQTVIFDLAGQDLLPLANAFQRPRRRRTSQRRDVDRLRNLFDGYRQFPAPVWMLINSTRDVRLIGNAQQIFEG